MWLTTANNTTDDATGLPVIVAGRNLTIAGHGAVLTRGAASGTPAFRFFDVAGGTALTLNNLILEQEPAFRAGAAALKLPLLSAVAVALVLAGSLAVSRGVPSVAQKAPPGGGPARLLTGTAG
jgi:hypothetical protein